MRLTLPREAALKTALPLLRSVCCLPILLTGGIIAPAPAALPPVVRGAVAFSGAFAAAALRPSVAEARRFGGGRSFGGFARSRSFGRRSFPGRSGPARRVGRGFSGRRGFGLGMGLGLLGGWGFGGGWGFPGLGQMLLLPLILLFVLRIMSRR